MRQISRDIDKRTGEGTVKLEPQDAEDMWHIFNLIAVGDFLRATTIRKIQQESATGTSSSERVRITLTIEVKSIEYDSLASAMRVTGRNIVENDHVKVGAFHTIELEPHRAFSLGKQSWDSVYVDRMDMALNPAADADLASIVMQDGLAHVLLVSRSLTITRARVETSIPRKGKNAIYNRDSALAKFFESVLRALLQHVDLSTIKVLLIASPGFVKDEFYKYMLLEASRRELRQIIDNKAKIVLCHASSGHKHAFQEVLSKPELQARLSNTKAVGEVQVLNAFHQMLSDNPERAVYGPSHVMYAAEMGAVGTLLVTDDLFRATSIKTRKKYVQLVEDVKAAGAQVSVFSAQHVTGEQLGLMSGVAAILRFPLADIDNLPSEEEEDDEEGDDRDKEGGSRG